MFVRSAGNTRQLRVANIFVFGFTLQLFSVDGGLINTFSKLLTRTY